MTTEIRYPKGLVVKCSHCYNDAPPDRVCHHCGQAFCVGAPPIEPAPPGRHNREFEAIKLEGRRRNAGVHCEAHQHGVRSPRRPFLRLGVLWLMVGGLWLAGLRGWLGSDVGYWTEIAIRYTPALLPVWLIGLGVAFIVVGQLLHWIFYSLAAWLQRPPCPLFPAWEKLARKEWVELAIHQTPDGGYHTEVGPVEGEILLTGRLSNQDRTRWQQFRKWYGPGFGPFRKVVSSGYRVSLGFLALRSDSTVQLTSPPAAEWNRGVCRLGGRADSFPCLADEQADLAVEQRWAYRQAVHNGEHGRSPIDPPVNTTTAHPAQAPVSGRDRRREPARGRAFEHDLEPVMTKCGCSIKRVSENRSQHLSPGASTAQGRASERVFRNLLNVTASFVARGSRQQIELCFQLSPPLQQRLRRVEHLSLVLNPAWGAVQESEPAIGVAPLRRGENGLEANVHRWHRVPPEGNNNTMPRFSIRVEHPIAPQDSLSGSFEFILRGSLADLDVVGLYDALGYRTQAQTTGSETVIRGRFELAVAALGYPQEASSKDEVWQPGAIPDYRLTGALAGLLAEQGYYVKQIEENPATVSRAGAHIHHRAWDIKGRRYLGLQPVDFHLVITGEEHYEGGNRPAWGNTRVEITTQGTAANETMAAQIQEATYQIKDIVQEALGSLAQVLPPRQLPVAPDHVSREASQPADESEQPPDEVIEGQAFDLQEVEQRLEQVETMFGEGKITPEQYMELRDRYERLAERLRGSGGG